MTQMTDGVEEIRRRMKEIGTVFIQDGSGYHVVPGQEEAASFLADAAWTLSGALAQAEREREEAQSAVTIMLGEREAAYRDRDAARAEVERLKEECGRLNTDRLFQAEERKHACEQWDAARAEVERLKATLGDTIRCAAEVHDEAQADLARVRAALEAIVESDYPYDLAHDALAALEGRG